MGDGKGVRERRTEDRQASAAATACRRADVQTLRRPPASLTLTMVHPIASSRIDLLLVGRKLPDNENLGIGYLLAAARRADLRAEMLILNGWEGVADTALRILAADPPLVGLAFPDGSSAVLPLALGQLLRDAGYRGHITAGGPFATLARGWLLERYPFIDSVVRYAGEAPLVALAEALSAGGRLTEVAGLTTRTQAGVSDGLPAPVLDTMQTSLVPLRGGLPQLLGYAMAQMTATRGCPGRCSYCGPASLQQGELDEGRSGGFSSLQLRGAGVGSVRRRPLEALCDEVAHLWHERDVRYVYFVDEHLLPRRSDDALAWIAGLRRGLEERGVGRLGFGCMLRGDLLSEPVIDAFAEAGLVRCFLGVELASATDLKRFQRGGSLERALASMRALDRRGVAVSCNLLLVHPDATVASIAAAIALTRSFDRVSFEAAQMHVYHGTVLQQRMEAEGRLLGNPLQYAYTFADPVVERFADLLNRLRLQAFGDYSLTCGIHDVAIALGLGERLFPDVGTGDLQVALAELGRASNHLRTGACEEALELALEGLDEERAGRFVARASRAAAPLACDVDRLSGHVLDRFKRPPARFRPLRAAAVPLVSVCLAGAVGCHPTTPEASDAPVAVPSVLLGSASPVDTTRAAPSVSTTSSRAAVCSAERAAELEDEVRAIIRRVEPCRESVLRYGAQDHDAGSEMVQEAVAAELGEEAVACLAEHDAMVTNRGDAAAEAALLRVNLQSCRAQTRGYADGARVEIGASGKVVSVTSKPPGQIPPPVRACIVKVLQGLRFPCLEGTTQHPWPKQMVIME